MEDPKLVIASDGQHTAVILDGVLLGPGIGRVDFSTEAANGEKKPVIRLMEIDVGAVRVDRAPDLEGLLNLKEN